MKKLISLLLALTMVLCLCACGAKEEAAAPAAADAYTVGICQLMEHESLDKASGNEFTDDRTVLS